MAHRQVRAGEALLSQGRAVAARLEALSVDDFDRPSVLPGWDVRTLVGHVALVVTGFDLVLGRPSAEQPARVWEFVRRYRRDVEQIEARTREVAGQATGPELVAGLSAGLDALATALTGRLPDVLASARGPITTLDFTETRVVELVTHADDLNRSLSDREPVPLVRAALGSATRTLTAILAGQSPGRSIEVRVPPYAAVQCGVPGDPGPTHTRGTPPNVVETDPVTFVRLATGRTSWADARTAHLVKASGQRANLTAVLPLLS